MDGSLGLNREAAAEHWQKWANRQFVCFANTDKIRNIYFQKTTPASVWIFVITKSICKRKKERNTSMLSQNTKDTNMCVYKVTRWPGKMQVGRADKTSGVSWSGSIKSREPLSRTEGQWKNWQPLKHEGERHIFYLSVRQIRRENPKERPKKATVRLALTWANTHTHTHAHTHTHVCEKAN